VAKIKILNRSFKETINIYPLCCIHIGSKNAALEKAAALVDKIRSEKNSYALLMGDTVENVIPDTAQKHKGSMYDQIMNPEDQRAYAVKFLSPIKDKIIAFLEGNHSIRSWYAAQFSPERDIAEKLGAPFLGVDGLFRFTVGKQVYKVHATHGHGNTGTSGGVLTKIEKQMGRMVGADLHIMGHYHTPCAVKKRIINIETGELDDRTFVATGSFMDYLDSYAHRALMSPSALEIPRITLYSNIKKAEVLL